MMMDLLSTLTQQYSEYTTLEIILETVAALLGVASVVFAMKKNILVYPTGIVSTALYVYLLFGWGLYGDTMINAYYFIMSIYGWYMWSKIDENAEHIPVTRMTSKEKLFAVLLFVASIALVVVVYHYKPYIESGFLSEKLDELEAPFFWLQQEVPFDVKLQYVDTLTTALFFVGMWLMARKKIENWTFWILGDIVSVPLYILKGHSITALQYFIFLIPAIMGLYVWRKDLIAQKQQQVKTS